MAKENVLVKNLQGVETLGYVYSFQGIPLLILDFSSVTSSPIWMIAGLIDR